jgi:5-methylcytosine-specific restriction protein A
MGMWRGSARARGYTSQWDRASLLFRQAHPLCLGCEAVGYVAASEVVDHVVPHKGNQVRFWDQSLWQPACRFHHDVVKQRLEVMYDHGAIVAADLWLNSKVAVAVTRRERNVIGADGWPLG